MEQHSHFIQQKWQAGAGPDFESICPATGRSLWRGKSADSAQVNAAVAAARAAFPAWAAQSVEARFAKLVEFRACVEQDKTQFAKVIAEEVGKPLWEAKQEVGAVIGKLDLSMKAYRERTGTVNYSAEAKTRHRPYGVVAVLGPYNFPAHLPNGHILPALLAGNTVVLKPSELTPSVSIQMMRYWQAAGLPAGVINLIQGGAQVGQMLSKHQDIDGLFFTGSYATGHQLQTRFASMSGKILALEMGGNNPLIVVDVQDVTAACYMTIQSAFLTSGQRCTCARRLIVPNGPAGDDFIAQLALMMGTLKIGAFDDVPEPFMGSVISAQHAKRLLQAQADLIAKGGVSLVSMKNLQANTGLLSPGLIDVSAISAREDQEIFGPLLQVIRVPDFEAALIEANNTAYGLSAGLLSDNATYYQQFYQHSRAGIVNWNSPITGASGAAPFGGVGQSGNFHPSAYYAADYCAYPVASIEASTLSLPEKRSPGLEV